MNHIYHALDCEGCALEAHADYPSERAEPDEPEIAVRYCSTYDPATDECSCPFGPDGKPYEPSPFTTSDPIPGGRVWAVNPRVVYDVPTGADVSGLDADDQRYQDAANWSFALRHGC